MLSVFEQPELFVIEQNKIILSFKDWIVNTFLDYFDLNQTTIGQIVYTGMRLK